MSIEEYPNQLGKNRPSTEKLDEFDSISSGSQINKCFDQLEEILPSSQDLNEFKELVAEFKNSITQGPIETIVKAEKDFESLNFNYDEEELKQKAASLDQQQIKINELKRKISECDSKYEKMCERKTQLQEKMKEFAVDRDIILAYKLGTLSNLCFSNKVKFGVLLDKNNLDRYKSFKCDLENNSPEDVECRWTILESFVNPQNDTSSPE